MFDVAAESYGRFMGRFSEPLAEIFIDFAGVRPGHRALDVGCGPGALTARLVERLGIDAVAAIDPSVPFGASVRNRWPGIDVRTGTAEELPYPDGVFDVALAQLVVHFMADPVGGLAQLMRVTRAGGVVAAAVWDHAGGTGPLALFWDAVREQDPAAAGEADLPGTSEGQLAGLMAAAGLRAVEAAPLTVTVPFASFAEWWEPYTLGVGPAGAYVQALSPQRREALKARCAEALPAGPLEITATAWCARGCP